MYYLLPYPPMLTIRVKRNEGRCGHCKQDAREKKTTEVGEEACGRICTWYVDAQETLGTQCTQGPTLHRLLADIPPSKTDSSENHLGVCRNRTTYKSKGGTGNEEMYLNK